MVSRSARRTAGAAVLATLFAMGHRVGGARLRIGWGARRTTSPTSNGRVRHGAAGGSRRPEREEQGRGALLARAQPEPVGRFGRRDRDDPAARARVSDEPVGQACGLAAARHRGAPAAQRRALVDGGAATASAGAPSAGDRAVPPAPPAPPPPPTPRALPRPRREAGVAPATPAPAVAPTPLPPDGGPTPPALADAADASAAWLPEFYRPDMDLRIQALGQLDARPTRRASFRS